MALSEIQLAIIQPGYGRPQRGIIKADERPRTLQYSRPIEYTHAIIDRPQAKRNHSLFTKALRSQHTAG